MVWGHDLELGLNWSNRVEPSLLKQNPGWSDMHRLSRLYLLELCLSDCYLLVLVFRFVFAQFFQMRLQYLCIQYWDNEVFLWAQFFKIMNFACISVWFGDESLHSVKDFKLECFCFALSCISKIIYSCFVITLPFSSDGLLLLFS